MATFKAMFIITRGYRSLFMCVLQRQRTSMNSLNLRNFHQTACRFHWNFLSHQITACSAKRFAKNDASRRSSLQRFVVSRRCSGGPKPLLGHPSLTRSCVGRLGELDGFVDILLFGPEITWMINDSLRCMYLYIHIKTWYPCTVCIYIYIHTLIYTWCVCNWKIFRDFCCKFHSGVISIFRWFMVLWKVMMFLDIVSLNHYPKSVGVEI